MAVLRSITGSNLFACSIGSSAGLAPLRILSTYPAARRKTSARLPSRSSDSPSMRIPARSRSSAGDCSVPARRAGGDSRRTSCLRWRRQRSHPPSSSWQTRRREPRGCRCPPEAEAAPPGPDRPPRSPERSSLAHFGDVHEEGDPREMWQDFLKELESLGDEIGTLKREARDVAPRPRRGGGEAAANRIADERDHDGNRLPLRKYSGGQASDDHKASWRVWRARLAPLGPAAPPTGPGSISGSGT